jgi:hypothetical protein
MFHSYFVATGKEHARVPLMTVSRNEKVQTHTAHTNTNPFAEGPFRTRPARPSRPRHWRQRSSGQRLPDSKQDQP